MEDYIKSLLADKQRFAVEHTERMELLSLSAKHRENITRIQNTLAVVKSIEWTDPVLDQCAEKYRVRLREAVQHWQPILATSEQRGDANKQLSACMGNKPTSSTAYTSDTEQLARLLNNHIDLTHANQMCRHVCMLMLLLTDSGDARLQALVDRDEPEWEAMRLKTKDEQAAAATTYETERDRLVTQIQNSDHQFIMQMFYTELKAEIHKEYDIWGSKWREAGQQVIDKYMTLSGCDPQYAAMLSRLSLELPAVQRSSKLQLAAIADKLNRYTQLINAAEAEVATKTRIVEARQATGRTPPFDTTDAEPLAPFVHARSFPWKTDCVRGEWLSLQQVLVQVAAEARTELYVE
jgi:hypothetical protein